MTKTIEELKEAVDEANAAVGVALSAWTAALDAAYDARAAVWAAMKAYEAALKEAV